MENSDGIELKANADEGEIRLSWERPVSGTVEHPTVSHKHRTTANLNTRLLISPKATENMAVKCVNKLKFK